MPGFDRNAVSTLIALAGKSTVFPEESHDLPPLPNQLLKSATVAPDFFDGVMFECPWDNTGFTSHSYELMYLSDQQHLGTFAECLEPEKNHGPHIPRRPQDPHARRPPERYDMMTI
jgi:hypothetical protein